MKASHIVLSLLFALSWIMYLDRAAISTAKELMASDLSLSNEAMGTVFGAFALGYALAQVPSGFFADRFGPRVAVATVVAGWSLFTTLTGLVHRFSSLVTVRFLFGAAEAGAFPASARVFFNWLPKLEHGRANGIIFSGSRLGAAMSFPILAWLLGIFGWRNTFLLLGLPGLAWAVIWLLWFRDNPPYRLEREVAEETQAGLASVLSSRPMLLAMGQYFASNFTFFLCLSWMHPYLMEQHHLSRERAAWYSMIVLLVSATAQWASGFWVDGLYRSRFRSWSRRLPAITGFVLAAIGVAMLAAADTPVKAVAFFMLAAFGAEMTISPSWAFCIDIGAKKSGAVSGAMNMIGNFGSFVSASLFPVLYRWTGDAAAYFSLAAMLNSMAAALWFGMRSSSSRR